MQTNRQELAPCSEKAGAAREEDHGEIVASALGFGAAYYFDAENGGLPPQATCTRTVDQAAPLHSACGWCPRSGTHPPGFLSAAAQPPRRGGRPAANLRWRAELVVAREVVPSSLGEGRRRRSGPSLRRPDPSHLAEVGPVT